MSPKEHLIACVIALCKERGGPEVVAERAGVSAEGLKQVIAGTKLPKSGNPRGVGPAIQAKLDVAYPGWSQLAASGSLKPSVLNDISELLIALGAQLATIPTSRREAVASNFAGWVRDGGADHWRQAVLALMLPQETSNAFAPTPRRKQGNG